MSGDVLTRVHNSPRTKLFDFEETECPFPMEFLDVQAIYFAFAFSNSIKSAKSCAESFAPVTDGMSEVLSWRRTSISSCGILCCLPVASLRISSAPSPMTKPCNTRPSSVTTCDTSYPWVIAELGVIIDSSKITVRTTAILLGARGRRRQNFFFSDEARQGLI